MQIRNKLLILLITLAMVGTSLPLSVIDSYADDNNGQAVSEETGAETGDDGIAAQSDESTGSDVTQAGDGTQTGDNVETGDDTGTDIGDGSEDGDGSDAEPVPYSQMTEEEKAAARAAARAKVAECQKAYNAAKTEQTKALAAYRNAGRAFVEEKSGGLVTVNILTNLYKNNSKLKAYAKRSSYNTSVASALNHNNLRESLEYIRYCNKKRVALGMEELKVSYRLMCFAATSSAIAFEGYTAGDGNLAAQQFYKNSKGVNAFPSMDGIISIMSENVTAVTSTRSPFSNWYTAQKTLYDDYLKETEIYPGLEELNYDPLEVFKKYPNDVYNDCGDFLNMMDPKAKVTGFAHNTSKKNWYIDLQCFSRNEEENGDLVTPDEFEAELLEYVRPLLQAYNAANDKLNEASQALKTAQAELDAMLTSIKGATISGVRNYVYSGTAFRPAIRVYYKGKLFSPSNYKVTYKNNKYPGTATVTVTGVDAYKASVSTTFKILPRGTNISKLKRAKKAFTVKWRKQAVQVSGYQIQYSRYKSFKKAKTITIKSRNTTSRKIKKLKKKKRYYVRIRTFKTVSGKRYYSNWSGAKSVKTK